METTSGPEQGELLTRFNPETDKLEAVIPCTSREEMSQLIGLLRSERWAGQIFARVTL